MYIHIHTYIYIYIYIYRDIGNYAGNVGNAMDAHFALLTGHASRRTLLLSLLLLLLLLLL